jgi:glucan phosphoethanolaminetransferase (alkaline phosphatase superfamily)
MTIGCMIMVVGVIATLVAVLIGNIFLRLRYERTAGWVFIVAILIFYAGTFVGIINGAS